MEHQDWATKILNSKKPINQEGDKKQYKKSKEQKLNDAEEEGKLTHKKMDSEFGKTLQKYRLSQGLTQKDIAQKLNIPAKDIIIFAGIFSSEADLYKLCKIIFSL